MASTPPAQLKRLSHSEYTVAWISPLEVEQIAAVEMLDEEHQSLPQSSRDHNVYKLGRIANHNIVIAGLHSAGNAPAATVVVQMRMTFPHLLFGLLVGIGGGVPRKTNSGWIRLGHVVVGKPNGPDSGIVQYDHGKALAGTIERTGALAPPPVTLLSAAQALAVHRDRALVDPVWQDTTRIPTRRRRLRRFANPGPANDHLYRADYLHRQPGQACDECGCDETQRVRRVDPYEDDQDDSDPEPFVMVHSGTIASGELVVKDAQVRDTLAKRHNVLCFETEAAGALTDFPCMVIRGISDYCDSHKNDVWHGFAAAVAAAYARQLFFHMPFRELHSASLDIEPTISPVSLPQPSTIERPAPPNVDDQTAEPLTDHFIQNAGSTQVVEELVSTLDLDSADEESVLDPEEPVDGEPLGESDPIFTARREMCAQFLKEDQPKAAETVARRMVDAAEREHGPGHKIYCLALNSLAWALYRQYRHQEADPLFHQVTRLCQRKLGEHHPDTLGTLTDYGTNLSRQGKHSQAETVLRKVIDVDAVAEPARYELGRLLCELRLHDEAEALFRELHDCQTQHLGEVHPERLNDLFSLDTRLGKVYYERSTTLYWLGRVLFWQDKLEESESTLWDVFGTQCKILHREDPVTCRTIWMLGRVLCRRGKREQGLRSLNDAVDILTRRLGRHHPETLEAISSLAKGHFDLGMWDMAEKNFGEVFTTCNRLLGADSLWTMDALFGCAVSSKVQGLYDGVEQKLRAVVVWKTRVCGEHHPGTLAALRELAMLLFFQSRDRGEEAEIILENVVKTYRRLLGPGHRDTLDANRDLHQVEARRSRSSHRSMRPHRSRTVDGHGKRPTR